MENMGGRIQNETDMGMPSYVTTFAGCGGSSEGYRQAGFRGLLAIEFDKAAAEAYRMNFPGVPVCERDIREISADKILDFLGIRPGELDLLDGSPPCQGFSGSNWRRPVADSRNDLAFEFARLVDSLKPKIFVMENVTGMARGKMKGRFNMAFRRLRETGYNVRCRILNAAFHGVPMSRNRLIWIGCRNGEPEFPAPKPPISFMEAVNGCKETPRKRMDGTATGRFAEHVKPGGTHKKHFNIRKAHPRKPCPCIETVPKIFHPSEKGLLTIPEIKRCASFPDSFKLKGSFTSQWKMIGNAVPPAMMREIAVALRPLL